MSRPRPLCRQAFSVLLLAALANISTSVARAQKQESQPHLTPEEIRLYHKAQTLIDWTPEQIQARPELQHLRAAESQEELPAILQDVGKRVAAFFDDFPNTNLYGRGPVGALLGRRPRMRCDLRGQVPLSAAAALGRRRAGYD